MRRGKMIMSIGRRGRVLALSAAMLFAPALMAADVPAGFEDAWSEVSQLYRENAAREGTVASSLYFLHDGRILKAEHFGTTRADGGRVVDADTLYHWASITKTFTAVAVMQLRDRGLLRLDDAAVDYLPELKQVRNPFGPMDAITLEQLLSHSGGFRAPTFPWRGKGDWKPHEPAEWSQVAAMMPYTEVLFAPGSKCSYSNLGMSALGRVVEIVTGDSIESYITKNILMPLGMTRSYFDVTPYYLQSDKTHSYYRKSGRLEDLGRELDTGATVANGGLNGTMGDMARWLDFWSGVGDRSHHDAVLSRASLAEMQRPRCSIAAGDDLQQQMGLAFFVIDYPLPSGENARYVGHTGGQKGYNDYVYVDPATGAAVIFANNTRNTDVKGGETVYRKTRRAVFERIFPLFPKRTAAGR